MIVKQFLDNDCLFIRTPSNRQYLEAFISKAPKSLS